MDTEKVRVLREKDVEIGRLQQQVQQLQVSSVWDMNILPKYKHIYSEYRWYIQIETVNYSSIWYKLFYTLCKLLILI